MACHQLMMMGLATTDEGNTKQAAMIKITNNFENFI